MKKDKNSSSMLTDALLNIVAEKHFDKKFDELDLLQKNNCTKYVLK